MKWHPSDLPYPFEIESVIVLKRLAEAHRLLAELKGLSHVMPNPEILINTLVYQEAKDSSEVENIITTHDELYRNDIHGDNNISPAAREVQNYVAAIKRGFELVKESGLLTVNHLLEIQQVLECNDAGFRKLPGTTLKNQQTGEVVFEPPQDKDEIVRLMGNLEQFINDESLTDWDPIVRMAVIHFQFESIHPFYDGNGRTGRIINILYLILNDLLDLPVLYLSRFIIRNKAAYYRLLQVARQENNLEEWLLYIIRGVKDTAEEAILLIRSMKMLMDNMKLQLQQNYKFFSRELLDNLFKHPYTKIEFVVKDLGVSRLTASLYLNKLAEDGVLEKRKMGKQHYYVNTRLLQLITQ